MRKEVQIFFILSILVIIHLYLPNILIFHGCTDDLKLRIAGYITTLIKGILPTFSKKENFIDFLCGISLLTSSSVFSYHLCKIIIMKQIHKYKLLAVILFLILSGIGYLYNPLLLDFGDMLYIFMIGIVPGILIFIMKFNYLFSSKILKVFNLILLFYILVFLFNISKELFYISKFYFVHPEFLE